MVPYASNLYAREPPKLLFALDGGHAHRGKKLLQDLQPQESAPMKKAMVRARGAREKGAMAFVECLGVSQEDTLENRLWRETLGRSLGSHDAAELVGGMCHGNGCRQETTHLHAISYTKTGWSSLTHIRALHQALARSLRESKVQFVVEDTPHFRERASGQNGRLNPLRMDITTEAGALFDNHLRLKNKALLLVITIVNPCASSNLGNAARHVEKHLADSVERKKNKYWGSFPVTYSLPPLAMSTCGKVGSDVHALIKELAIRRVDHRSETHSNESQHLAEGTEVARLRRRFSFVLQQALSFRTRHHLCRYGVALVSTRQLHSQGPVSGQAHRTEGREGANGVGGVVGVGGRNGDGNGVGRGNGDVNGHRDGDGAGAGTGTGVEVNEGAQDWNGDGSEGISGDGNEDGSEDSSGDENRDEDNGNGNEDMIGRVEERRRSVRNRTIVLDVKWEAGKTWVERRKNVEKKRVGPVAANPDNLESNKEEAEGGAQGTQGSSKNCTSRESVSPLSRLIRGFRNKYH